MLIQKLFKEYIVRREKGQCQILIPLSELDELCERIEMIYNQPLINNSGDSEKGKPLEFKGKNGAEGRT